MVLMLPILLRTGALLNNCLAARVNLPSSVSVGRAKIVFVIFTPVGVAYGWLACALAAESWTAHKPWSRIIVARTWWWGCSPGSDRDIGFF